MIQCQPPARGMLRAAERGCARAAHQGRATQRKDLKFVSLVLTQLQHWRCQVIAAACPCPTVCDRHVQPMSQQTPRKLRDSVSVAEARMLAIGTSNTVTKGDGNSRPVGSKRRDSRRPVRPRTCPKKPKKKVIATFRIPELRIAM
jgi:hypothetical protein